MHDSYCTACQVRSAADDVGAETLSHLCDDLITSPQEAQASRGSQRGVRLLSPDPVSDYNCTCNYCDAEPQDPDGVMAAVADFGLSRALAFGQVRGWGYGPSQALS